MIAGCYQLTYQIHDEIQYSFRTASGNARQRRKQVRIWRRQGFVVTHH